MIYIALVAFLYVSIIVYGAIVKSEVVNDPANFEVHPHVKEEEEINPSVNPFGWWLKVTFGK